MRLKELNTDICDIYICVTRLRLWERKFRIKRDKDNKEKKKGMKREKVRKGCMEVKKNDVEGGGDKIFKRGTRAGKHTG